MDDELRTFLAEQFHRVDQRFDAVDLRLEGVDRRLDGVDQRLEGMDQHLATVDPGFAMVGRRFDTVDERFDAVYARIDEVRREFGVMAEHQQGLIRLVAEGHAMLHEDMDRRSDAQAADHADTRAAIKFSHAELDRRITRLEAVTGDLDTRVSRLEQVQ